jgi:hypothetical protein
MNLHPLSPDFPCPSCGAAKLTFRRMGRHKSDMYFCEACGCYVAHRRPRGQLYCETSIRGPGWEYLNPRRCRDPLFEESLANPEVTR